MHYGDIFRKLSRAIPALVLTLFVVGCGSIAPTQTASKLDLKQIYIDELAKKYSPGNNGSKSRFAQLREEYDNLPSLRAAKEEELRQADLKKIGELETRLEQYKQTLSEAQFALGKEQATLSKYESDLKEQQELLNALLALPNAPQNGASSETTTQDSIGKARATIRAIKGQVSEQQARIAYITLEIERTKAKIDATSKSLTSLYGISYPDPVEKRRKEIRKEVADDLMSISDHNYLEFKNSLLSGRAQSDALLDITELLFSTATTLTGGVMAKTNLGAASTFMKGSRASVDKNFFAQSTLAAIINAVESTRQSDRRTIAQGLAKSTDEYSLQDSIADIERYDSRSNLLFAVLEITNQTSANLKAQASE